MAEPIIRGQPDWGKSAEHTFTGTGQSDLELGSRLKWPFAQAYDGEIHFYDDFEAGVLHWVDGCSTSDQGVDLDRVRANSLDQSVKLTAPAGAGEYAYIDRGIVAPVASLVGLGMYVSPESVVGKLEFTLSVANSGYLSVYRARYTFSSGLVEVSVNSVWTAVGTIRGLLSVPGQFSWLQLVVDVPNRTYKSIVIGGSRLLLSNSPDESSATPNTDSVEMYINYENTAVTASPIWIDDIIVTRNVKLPTE